MNIILTGVAGFIGFHTAKFFLKKKYNVLGIDNLNDYYDVKLKLNRLNHLKKLNNFSFIKSDIQNKNLIKNLKIKNFNANCIINLAAQAGVRHSLKDPYSYVNSNILGQLNILELIKKKNTKIYLCKFIFSIRRQ